MTFTDLHDFSFNIQMCMSQKISRYKFVFLNTALIFLCLHHLPFQISGMEQERKHIENLQVNLSTIIFFYITDFFLVAFLSNLIKCVLFILFHVHTLPHHLCSLSFMLSFLGFHFYFFPLVFRIKWSSSNGVLMVRECNVIPITALIFCKDSSYNFNLSSSLTF